jgi:hypothetical protein
MSDPPKAPEATAHKRPTSDPASDPALFPRVTLQAALALELAAPASSRGLRPGGWAATQPWAGPGIRF